MKIVRAWATLEIKGMSEDNPDGEMTLEGIASTPSTDRMGDIIDPMGAQFKLPMPFLWQHNSREPIGLVTFAKPTKAGIPFKATIARKGVTKFIDDARALIKERLVRGVSIGFSPKESEPINSKEPWGAQIFKLWEWLELSAVTIAANEEATITSIKSIDQRQRAASGHSTRVVSMDATTLSGASEKSAVNTHKREDMTTQERIAGFEAKRAALSALMLKLIEESDGSTLSAEQKTQYDEAKADVLEIDEHLVRLRDVEKLQVRDAVPITKDAGVQSEPAKQRVAAGEGVISLSKALPPGIGMARYVKALAFAKGNYQQAGEYAKQWDTSTPEVGLALKTAIGAGTTTDSTWAGPLVYAQDFPAAFLDYLRPQTIIGKLLGISMVPFNIRYGVQDGGSTVAWVGQGAAKPVSKLSFTSGSLGFAKAAGIVVITQELARFSSPSAELKVRDDLTNQMVYFLDQQFIDPGVAAVANVSPASVLNGASNVRQAAAAWTSMANVLTDVKVLLQTFAANEISLQGAYWVMTPDAALSLSMLLTTGGENFAFPDISVNGGMFLKIPVIVSNAVPHSVSAGSVVALIVPKHIYLADDGQVAIDASTEASLNMDSAPTNNSATPTATSLVSMFQTNSIAIRAERIINWSRARNYGVGYIDNMHTS